MNTIVHMPSSFGRTFKILKSRTSKEWRSLPGSSSNRNNLLHSNKILIVKKNRNTIHIHFHPIYIIDINGGYRLPIFLIFFDIVRYNKHDDHVPHWASLLGLFPLN